MQFWRKARLQAAHLVSVISEEDRTLTRIENGGKSKLKKRNLRINRILPTLMITLTLLVTLIPSIYIPSGVKAQSTPALVLDVSSGYVGDYVTVTGSGFEPDKYVTFMWGNELFSSLGFISGMSRFQRPSYDKPGEVWTDALGNFIVQLQVPKLTAGTYTIRADDTMNAATAEFTINAKIMLRNQYAYKKHGTSATPSQTKSSPYYFGLFLTEGFVGDMLAIQLSDSARTTSLKSE